MKTANKQQQKCAVCRRQASVHYQGKWYCRTDADQLLGISAKRPAPKTRPTVKAPKRPR